MEKSASRVTDEELMGLVCTAPDRESADRAFDEVFERYHRRVVAWCCRILRNREASKDLAQEIFLKAYRHRHAFRGDARLSTWLYAIARNHCLTAIRRPEADTQRFDSLAIMGLVDRGIVAPDRAAEQNELAARLRRLMSRVLEPIEARVMTLHYGHEVPLAAITRHLGLRNPSGAKAYIVNGRRKLGKIMRRRTGI